MHANLLCFFLVGQMKLAVGTGRRHRLGTHDTRLVKENEGDPSERHMPKTYRAA
jgi:hypothetical protein